MKEGHSDMLASHKQMGKKEEGGPTIYTYVCWARFYSFTPPSHGLRLLA